jgi:hypothetical protein
VSSSIATFTHVTSSTQPPPARSSMSARRWLVSTRASPSGSPSRSSARGRRSGPPSSAGRDRAPPAPRSPARASRRAEPRNEVQEMLRRGQVFAVR